MNLHCNLCKEHYKDGRPLHFGSDPKCGFNEKGEFDPDNWMCITMNRLRSIVETSIGEQRDLPLGCFFHRDDMEYGSIGIVAVREGRYPGFYLVMSWYKSRGRTSRAVVTGGGGPEVTRWTGMAPLTLELAEIILKQYTKETDGTDQN